MRALAATIIHCAPAVRLDKTVFSCGVLGSSSIIAAQGCCHVSRASVPLPFIGAKELSTERPLHGVELWDLRGLAPVCVPIVLKCYCVVSYRPVTAVLRTPRSICLTWQLVCTSPVWRRQSVSWPRPSVTGPLTPPLTTRAKPWCPGRHRCVPVYVCVCVCMSTCARFCSCTNSAINPEK